MATRSQRAMRSATGPRSSRHAKPKTTYVEISDEEEEEEEALESEEESEGESEEDLRASRKRKRGPVAITRPKRRRAAASSSSTSTPPSSRKQRRNASPSPSPSDSSQILYEARPSRSTPRKSKSATVRTPPAKPRSQPLDIHTQGKTMPWQTLPYQVLVQIFQYAAYPLYDGRSKPNSSIEWLLKMSRLCKGFAEPALTALYRAPPLTPMERAHMLRNLLAADASLMSYNYRSKVEKLYVEVHQTAAYTLPGHGLLDLCSFVYNTPRLQDLEFFHQHDLAPFRNLDEAIRWSYPEGIFDALSINVDGVPTNLRSWRWSSRLAGRICPLESLKSIHERPCFARLRKLAFVNYQISLAIDEPKLETALANSLSVLPSLEHLIFESSTLFNAKLLPLLPSNLKHLEIINCWEVISEDFGSFLVSHGGQLESLVLDHNQSLSFSFLPLLKAACPKLVTLRANLTYFQTHQFYKDSEPQYDELLRVDEIPQWPETLQHIELVQLRKWNKETAEAFFDSLLNSSEALPDLRHLVMKVSLNLSNYRERTHFRIHWEEKFAKVFKRESAPPDPNFRSIGAHRAHLAGLGRRLDRQLRDEAEEDIATKPKQSHRPVPPTQSTPERRLSSELRSLARSAGSSKVEPEKPSRNQLAKQKTLTREAARLTRATNLVLKKEARSAAGLSNESEDDSDDAPLAARTSTKGKGKRTEYIQGMCDVVDVRIDSLRPTEVQFTAADFLDSEPEGDSDYDGTGGGQDEGYAW